jgi:hypothetical protein
MKFKLGDIVITHGKGLDTFGHVLMCVKGGASPDFIHASSNKGFQIDSHPAADGPLFKDDSTAWRLSNFGQGYSEILLEAAYKVRGARYSVASAIKAAAGSSKFGKGARETVAKVQSAMDLGQYAGPVCCSSAVIICYQIAYSEGDENFIDLDSEHTLPHTLEAYFESSAQWSNPPK